MKNWLLRNEKAIIASAFIIPIIIVAIVSISHVTQWYGLSNPLSWALYLSIGVEIAAMSALAAITAKMGKNVYFPFIIVTLLQFIGNIFFSYSYININSIEFKNWVELVSPLVTFIGIEPTDLLGHKRFLALFSGGMLPIISLSFLHMLIKYSDRISNEKEKKPEISVDDNKQIITETIEVLNEKPFTDTIDVLEKEPILEKKTEIIKEESNSIEDVMFINLNDIPDVIEPVVNEVIDEEPIVQPEVTIEVVEDVRPNEQTLHEFLDEIYEEIGKDENIEEEIVDNIIESSVEQNINNVSENTEENKKNIEQNFTSTSSITNVKNYPKIKRNGSKFTPPEIKWKS